MNTLPTEYIDRANAMNVAAREELKRKLTTGKIGFDDDVAIIKERTVAAVNRAIIIGDNIQEFTGHKKLLQSEYGQLALAVSDAPINFAKFCVSLREANDGPVTSYEVAAPIFERLLVQYELLPKPAHGEQTKHPHEPIVDFISSVIDADTESVELLEENPMEKWQQFQIVTFANNSKRIHDLHELAIKLMEVKSHEHKH